jgi:sialate O-acetylesterase
MNKKALSLFATLFLLAGTLSAEVKLPALVSDNMVLQQNTNVKVWGWAKPGAKVVVTPSWGEKSTTVADKNGDWQVTISTPPASFDRQEITISDGEPVTIKDVLIGEVWLCSGQSNMEMNFLGTGPSGVLGANQTIAESGLYPDLRLFHVAHKSATSPEKDCQGKWVRSSPENIRTFSAIGYLFGLQLHKILNVPVGIINTSWGGTIIEAWMDSDSQQSFTDVDLSLVNDEKVPVFAKPISLYNGMIAPLINYSLRGFLWYQGESNVPRHTTYADKMVAMIKLWRRLWGNDSMPFFYAEIAPYNYAANRMDMSEAQIDAALLREQQARVMDMIDNVGMVCTNDLVFPYEKNEIHPSDKPEVARRFSYWALSMTYGFADALSVTGPRYKSMKIENGKAVLSFTVSDQGGFFGSKGDITGFEIAGSDRVFYPAKAVKVFPFSRELTVSSDSVPEPVAVRYCFRNWLPGNVCNVYGLPLIPFRTDDW